MQSRIKKTFAYMDTLRNNKGMTMVSMLLSLTILLTTLSFVPFLFTVLEQDSHYDDISTRQFFHFLQEEFRDISNFTVNGNSVQLMKQNGEVVTIEPYQDQIRRRVNYQGHEILLRNCKIITIQTSQSGVIYTITTVEGNTYEKTISKF